MKSLLLFAALLLLPLNTAQAVVVQSRTTGISIGNEIIQLQAAGDNLVYGLINRSATGSFIKLQDFTNPNTYTDLFKVDYAGNVTTAGVIISGSQAVCLQNGSGCPAAAATGWTDDGAVVRLTTPGDNVGIGTTAPNTKLTVYNSGGGKVDLETSDPTVTAGDVLGELQFRGLDASVLHQVGDMIRAYADQAWDGSANDAPTRLEFLTQSDGAGDGLSSPQLTIDSTGYIGIGIVSPGDNLHVYTNTTQTTPQMYIEQNSTGDAAIELGIVGASYIVGIDNSDSDNFKISYSGTQGAGALGTNDRLVINSSGNVGIGTTNPGTYKLAVAGAFQLQGSVFDATNAVALYLNGNSDIQLRLDADELTAPGANTFKINNGANSTVLAVDESGNLTVGGAIAGATIDTGPGATEVYPMNQNLRTTDSPTFGSAIFTGDQFVVGRVGIGGPPSAKLQVNPGVGVEGIRVIASDYSPFVIRNTSDASDLLRLNQGGNLTVSGTVNNRLIGTGLGNIAVNAGAGVTNTGLDANYLQGHSWNDVTNLLADAGPQTPERHYFISAATTTGAAGGFSGLDAKCEADANALVGRDYHAYALAATGRNFRNGVLYSNKLYGTFAVTGVQDPDLCRVLGITCNANWLAFSSLTVWGTDTASCGTWSTTAGQGSAIVNPLRGSGTPAGTVYGSGTGYICSETYKLLCIENSGPMTVPGAICGNGAIESGEYCDDGNTANDATCPANCQADGGYCGDGYNASDEVCDYNNASYINRARCSGSCTWQGDLDGDGATYTGQNDCWNNDVNAYPGSLYEGTTSKDYNCDGNISSRYQCSAYGQDFAYSGECTPPPPSQAEADAWCRRYEFPSGVHPNATAVYIGPGYCNTSDEISCSWCSAGTTYYW